MVVGAFATFAFVNLWLPFVALEVFSFLNSHCGAGAGTTTTTPDQAQAPLLLSEVLPPLAAVGALFAAVALTYRHLTSRHVHVLPVGDGRRRSISGLVMCALCVSAGTLELIVFGGQAAGGGGGAGHAAQARALGLAALHALPAAATVTFFCGMMLIIVASAAHVRAGGEAGGTGGAVAGDGPIQGLLLRVLPKVAAGMTALLVVLMAMSLTAKS